MSKYSLLESKDSYIFSSKENNLKYGFLHIQDARND